MDRVRFVGRPNVGKSSLFNALLKKPRANVLDLPGTTLDDIVEIMDFGGQKIKLIDTQGLFTEKDMEEVGQKLTQASGLVFVVDGREGLTPLDWVLAKAVRKTGLPVLLCVNKCEAHGEDSTLEFDALGFDEKVYVSSAHRQNLDSLSEWWNRISPPAPHLKEDLVEEVIEVAPKPVVAAAKGTRVKPPPDLKHMTLALIGRPNAGKSTLMNRLCGEPVSLTSPIAHTTRDPVSHIIKYEGAEIRVLDTAGMRRKRTKASEVEELSVEAAKEAAAYSNVAILMVSALDPLTDQDLSLIDFLETSGAPTLVLFNFWDQLKPDEQKTFLIEAKQHHMLRRLKMLPISALSGYGVKQVLPTVFKLFKSSQERITTSRLNSVMERILEKNPPPAVGTRRFNILYATQVKSKPATFVLFVNRKASLPESYKSYLNNELRRELRLKGQPIRIVFRGGEK